MVLLIWEMNVIANALMGMLVSSYIALALVSDRCRICEDVVQTWHDHFRCSGEYPTALPLTMCDFPSFSCKNAPPEMRGGCVSLFDALRSDTTLIKNVWESLFFFSNVYQTCSQIDMCPKDSDQDGISQCHHALRYPECKRNPFCSQVLQECSNTCILCNLLIRDWPVFQGICKPADVNPYGAILESTSFLEIGTTSTKPHSISTLETQARETGIFDKVKSLSSSAKTLVSEAKSFASNAITLLSDASGMSLGATVPPIDFSPEPVKTHALGESAIQKECFHLYDSMRFWKKALYFSSWKKDVSVFQDSVDSKEQEIWDSNTVCKCLGQCTTSKFEEMELHRVCHYDAHHDSFMTKIFEINLRNS